MKRIVSLIILVLLCLTLCGCQSVIDDMRKTHAVYTPDGQIEYDGRVYKALPYSQYIYVNGGMYIYVTAKDVPLLLSRQANMYTPGELYKDKMLMSVNAVFYSEESKYDDIKARIERGEQTPECYYYPLYDRKTTGIASKYYLTDAQTQIIKTAVLGEKVINMDYDYVVDLIGCSADDIFTYERREVYFSDGIYYISEKEDLHYANTGNETYVYKVDSKYNSVMKEILKVYLES